MGNMESREKAYDISAHSARRCRRAFTDPGGSGRRHGWYSSYDLKSMRPREGDLIEIERNYYAHWAVCVGLGPEGAWVIHSTVDEGIRLDKLVDIVADDECRVNNRRDGELEANAGRETVARARYYYENPDEVGRFNRVSNNCEHFATRCRYNRKYSEQVEGMTLAGLLGMVGVAALFLFKCVLAK